MPKELLDKLKRILDWWKIEDFTDRKGIEKELTSLLNDAYSQGWDDAKKQLLKEILHVEGI